MFLQIDEVGQITVPHRTDNMQFGDLSAILRLQDKLPLM